MAGLGLLRASDPDKHATGSFFMNHTFRKRAVRHAHVLVNNTRVTYESRSPDNGQTDTTSRTSGKRAGFGR